MPMRGARPLADILRTVGLAPAAQGKVAAVCPVVRSRAGAVLQVAGAARDASIVVRSGLVLRRGVDGRVPRAVGIAGRGEVLGLDGPRMRRHRETLVAITAVEIAVVEAGLLWASPPADALLGRVVFGPQSVAHLGHWSTYARLGAMAAGERVREGLGAMAQLAGGDPAVLSDMVLAVDDLAQWLATGATATRAALAALQQRRLARVEGGTVCAIDPAALRHATGTLRRGRAPAR